MSGAHQFLESINPKFASWFAAQPAETQSAIVAKWGEITDGIDTDPHRFGNDAKNVRVSTANLHRCQRELLEHCASAHGYDFT